MNLRASILALACLCLTTASLASAAELLPYQAAGWRYRQVAPGDPLEGTFMQPSFDDNAWAVGQAAFGSNTMGCPLQATNHTAWGLNSAMLLRNTFAADPASAVTIHFSIDNDASVWVNGVLAGSVVHEGCSGLDDWNLTVPPGALQLGANLVAVYALDRGGETFFDLRVEGTPPAPVPVKAHSWGALKAVYR